MKSPSKRTIFWLCAMLMALVASYCFLAIIQAGSLYTGERATNNLHFWGTCMGGAVLGAVAFGILAARVGKTDHQKKLGS